jgi:hypothetical protein
MKQGLLVLLLLSLGSIFTLTLSGCSMLVTGREITVTPTVEPPTSDVTPPSTEPATLPSDTTPSTVETALPLIDTVAHGTLETAYFALG